MLDKYTQHDSLYRAYAFKICKCHDLKDDLVNDMYLKLNDILTKNPEKQISKRFVYLMIRSIFLDGIKKKREIPVSEFPDIQQQESDNLKNRIMLNEKLDELSFFDREILLKTNETSLRKLGKQINVKYQSIYKYKKKALEKLKELCREEESQKV